jgi:hypothetical protein
LAQANVSETAAECTWQHDCEEALLTTAGEVIE